MTPNAEDEWRGTTNPRLRRRVQNRLNQRAYRRRRRILASPENTSKRVPDRAISTAQSLNQRNAHHPSSAQTGAISLHRRGDTGHSGKLQVSEARLQDRHALITDARVKPAPWYTDTAAVAAQFRQLKLGRHAAPSPSNDHLLCIMQFSVMRAFGTISSIIGLSPAHLLDDDASSPFSSHAPPLTQPSPAAEELQQFAFALPQSLAPTPLQTSTPHHPWIDILPCPQMRDNLLRLDSSTSTTRRRHYDPDSLCHWMVGLDAGQKEAGLILWGEPWDLAAWEVTADFFHGWGWLLEGCFELFEATNYWRGRRGLKPLFPLEKK
ncbi:hypothetical protein J3F83DRAFT_744760 [Trichoderma novae-zelandiae]